MLSLASSTPENCFMTEKQVVILTESDTDWVFMFNTVNYV